MSSVTARTGYAEGAGWVVFASILLFIAGTWNFIDGILAIGDSMCTSATRITSSGGSTRGAGS